MRRGATVIEDRRMRVTAIAKRVLWVLIVSAGIVGAADRTSAQDADDPRAITARVHGTFQDATGGLGVVSGDMTIARFELLGGSMVAIGRIEGAMADASGEVLGKVDQELALSVANIGSTCNQLRMDLASTDAQVLQRQVHFDHEVAGFDSRDGATPRVHPALCAAGRLLRSQPAADAVMRALNDVVTALAAKGSRP
jgi:hypothetical protein